MNKVFKIVSSTVAAVVMLTGGIVYAGAKNASDYSGAYSGSNCVTVAGVKSGNCNNLRSLLDKLGCKDGNCDVQSVLDKLGCKDGNCDVQSVLDKLGCKDGNCDVQSVLDKLGCKDGNIDFQSLLKQLCGGKCPNFNTGSDTQSPSDPTESTEPTEPTEGPVNKPTAPAETPTAAPTQAPTQAPTVAPTQAPTVAPTQSPVTEPSEKATEPVTTKPSQTTDFNKAYEDEVIRLVNIERAKYGLSALAKRDDATNAAEIRAKEIVRNFSHTRPNGTSCFTVASELGISYRSVGENIAYGYSTPAQVVNGWMNSEGHRANILSSSFTGIGVGCYKQGNTLYWSQFFIG